MQEKKALFGKVVVWHGRSRNKTGELSLLSTYLAPDATVRY
jgi:hypothetical protein